MNVREVIFADEKGQPKRRHYELLRERFQRQMNRMFWQSCHPFNNALNQFAKEIEAEFIRAGVRPRSCQVSSCFITLQWQDGTEISVRCDEKPWNNSKSPRDIPPQMVLRKVNDHMRRLTLSKHETAAGICQRTLAHFRHTKSELALACVANHNLTLAA